MAMPPPIFLIIGAQKSGTTSLYDFICKHPDVFPARFKEIHYFSLNYAKGLDWYLSNFPVEIGPGQITGEATPYYLFHPYSAMRIHKQLPGVKLIAVLRDPVERAISHYFHAVARNNETREMMPSFQADLEPLSEERSVLLAFKNDICHQQNSYIQRGYYSRQLSRYSDLFPAESLLLVSDSELYQFPGLTINRIYDHLGIGPLNHLQDFPELNKGQYPQHFNPSELEGVRDWLRAVYRDEYRIMDEKYAIRF